MRRSGWESTYPKRNERVGTRGSIPDGNNQVLKMQTSRNKEVETDKGAFVALFLGEKELGSMSQTPGDRERRNKK